MNAFMIGLGILTIGIGMLLLAFWKLSTLEIEFLRAIVDMIDTVGGHILLSVFLGLFGVTIVAVSEYYHFEKTATTAGVLTGFLQVAGYAMRGIGNAAGQPAKPPSDKETTGA